MTGVKTKRQEQSRSKPSGKRSKMGMLSVIMTMPINPAAAADLLRLVRWPDGVVRPHCKKSLNIKKRGMYKTCLQRYYCKDCKKSFNDKTGTILHYKHIGQVSGCCLFGDFLRVRLMVCP